jgi:CDP-glycerol glycerophosphotransferase
MLESRLISSVLSAVLVRVPQLVFKSLLALLTLFKEFILKFGANKVDALFARIGKWYVAKNSKVDQSLVVFVTGQNDFTCNPKYIALEMLKRDSNLRLVWAVDGQTKGPFPQEMDFVQFGKAEFYKTVARAKVVVMNNHAMQIHRVFKNQGRQFWIQTWHGSLGFKKLEGSGGRPKFYKKARALDVKQTDFVISNSRFEEDVFSSTFWPGIEAKRLGHARNDILFDSSSQTNKKLRLKVLTRLGIEDEGQKFVMFAPTHNDTNPNQSFAHIDFSLLTAKLSDKFGGRFEVLVRNHNSNRKKSDSWLSGLPAFCHNASDYPDMQELMMISDVGLTDYSSWICDYLITKRPGFLITANLSEFEQTRGFYHDFADTPFALATTNDQLIQNIESFAAKAYEAKIEKFFDRCGLIDDGQASVRIAEFIQQLVLTESKKK